MKQPVKVVSKLSIQYGRHIIEVLPDDETFRAIVKEGSDVAARKIADEIDRVREKRDLQPDELCLRRIIKEQKGF